MPSKKGSRKGSKKRSRKMMEEMEGGAENTYCVYCHKRTPTLKAHMSRTSNGRKMLKGVCKLCGHNKTSFVKG